MLKKPGFSSNISLIFIVVLVMLGLFGLTTVFAASGSGLLNRRIDVEATAQAIRFENRRVLLQATADHRLAVLESEIEQARHALGNLQQTIHAQSTTQGKQLAEIRQEVQDKQATVQNMESKLMQVQLAIKADEETFNAGQPPQYPDEEQVKNDLLRQIRAVEAQLATAQAQLAARPTPSPVVPAATIAPIIINNPDQNNSDSGSKDRPDSSEDDGSSDDNKTESDETEDSHSKDDSPDDTSED